MKESFTTKEIKETMRNDYVTNLREYSASITAKCLPGSGSQDRFSNFSKLRVFRSLSAPAT
jgi:hypothetical protein